jgi:hypothetical protein
MERRYLLAPMQRAEAAGMKAGLQLRRRWRSGYSSTMVPGRWAQPSRQVPIVFAAHWSVLACVAAAMGFNPFRSSTWLRWDSHHYLSIARGGYTPLVHCPPASGAPPTAWCGNAGWFPGYSWVIRAVAWSGIPAEAAGLLIASGALLGILLLVARAWPGRWMPLWLAAFFPGNIYYAAIFPCSLFVFLACSCLRACREQRWAPAALTALFAACCYPTGILLALVIGIWAVWRRTPAALLPAAGAGLGFALVRGTMRLQTGAWDAYTKVHAGYQMTWGVEALYVRLRPFIDHHYQNDATIVTGLQTLLVLSLVFRGLWQAMAQKDVLSALYLAAFWSAPLALGGGPVSLYRSESLLLPVVFLLPQFSVKLQRLLVGVAILLSVPMTMLFLTQLLV